MSKADLDRFTDFMVEYKEEVAKDYEEEIKKLNYIIDKQDRDITSLTKSKIKLKKRTERAINYCYYLMGKKLITALQVRKIGNILRGVDKK